MKEYHHNVQAKPVTTPQHYFSYCLSNLATPFKCLLSCLLTFLLYSSSIATDFAVFTVQGNFSF
jgi:hypothetical protein